MKVELKNNLGTVYTSTQDVETTIRHNPEKLCKNCKHWERNATHDWVDKKWTELPADSGDCLFSVYSQPENKDRLEGGYEDSKYAITGENFGCIHFKEKC